MKIRLKRRAILLIVFIFIFSGCKLSTALKSDGYKNKYSINIYYNPKEASIYGTQKISYRNTEDVDINELYFHLYANAFRDKSTAPMIGEINDSYPEGFNPGQIDIVDIWIDNSKAVWNTEGEAKTLLCVKLSKPLKANEKISIRMDFQEKLPHARTDFGEYGGIACFENWYPVLCIYDSKGWHKEAFSKLGEANFSEISDYNVDINLPENEVVASTGKPVRERADGDGRKNITIKAESVRDFTWVSSSSLKKVEKKYKGILIKSYFTDKDKVRGVSVLDTCSRAFDFYNEAFGPYPYDEFSVVETCLYGGAMEYPMMTTVGELYYTYQDPQALEGAVAHEIAHQWWYVTVGNNEYAEPWLDESLATYSEAMYFEKYRGREMLKQRINPEIGLTRSIRNTGDSMGQFKNINEYNLVVYLKGAYMLNELREKVGDKNFFDIMKRYYEAYRFKNADTNNFLDTVKGVCGEEAVEFIKLRLYGSK
jgi:Aminopeptidase N